MIAGSRIKNLINGGLYAAIFAIPLSPHVTVLKSDMLPAKMKIPLFDCIVWAVFIVWLYDTCKRRGFANVKLPPLPVLAFAAAATCSALLSGDILGSVKDLIQIIDAFVIFSILFVNTITTRAQIERVILCLGIVSTVIVICGAVQFAYLGGKPHLVRSMFDSRNVLAGFLAMTIPLLLSFDGERYGKSMWFVRGVVVIGGIAITTAFFPFFILLAAMCIVSIMKYRRAWPAAVVIVLFALAAVSPVSVPFSEIRNPRGEFFEPRNLAGYHEQIRRSVEMTYYGTLMKVGVGSYAILVSTGMTTPRALPTQYVEALFNAHRKDAAFGEGAHIAQRFIEWRAALNILDDRPALGVGTGRYQKEIGRFYSYLPKLNTMEPDAQNGYCITLFTTGLIGLGCLVWILRHFFRRVRLMSLSAGDVFTRDLSRGLSGSLLGFTFINLFVPVLGQNTVAVFVLVLSISVSMGTAMAASDGGARPEGSLQEIG